MVHAIRELEAATRWSRITRPAITITSSIHDLNSWHFYIDDHDQARGTSEGRGRQPGPGSGFNYCPGLSQSILPLINSEYGAVSAGSGDRDISWGLRDLTTQLRRHRKIQGFVYTELADIEWEHNGLVNYDRTPKLFGYDAWLPDMRPNELLAPTSSVTTPPRRSWASRARRSRSRSSSAISRTGHSSRSSGGGSRL